VTGGAFVRVRFGIALKNTIAKHTPPIYALAHEIRDSL
jgi:hypothetical protein